MNYFHVETKKLQFECCHNIMKIVNDWESEFFNEAKEAHSIFSDEARNSIGKLLFDRIYFMSIQTLESLFNDEFVLRYPDCKWGVAFATQEMKNNTMQSLIGKLNDNPRLLYDNSPLLEVYIEKAIEQFSDMLNELIGRIAKDKEDICHVFFKDADFGKIIGIDGSKSDRHLGGRQALIIETYEGKFLYKPKRMKFDNILHQMVLELFPNIISLPKVIDCGEYGYAEYLSIEYADGNKEAKEFFYNLGGTMSLFKVFASTDFHVENILAKGVCPALVDLETFISHPQPGCKVKCVFYPNKAEDLFEKDCNNSIVFSGVLPNLRNGIELSPLLSKAKNTILPLVNGKHVDVRGYIEYLKKGFEDTYKSCMENKDRLLAYLDEISDCQTRVLLRNTDDYSVILKYMYASRTVKSGDNADAFIDRMEAAFSKYHEVNTESCDLISVEEINAIKQGDVPIFHCIINSKDLYLGDRRLIKDYFEESAYDNVKYRIEHLSEADLDFEIKLIIQSIEQAYIPATEAPSIKWKENKCLDFISFSDEAHKIFERVISKYIIGPSGMGGFADNKGVDNSFGYLDYLYGRRQSGVIAYMIEYYSVTGDERAKKIIAEYANKIIMRVDSLKKESKFIMPSESIGMTGLSGTIKTMIMAGKALKCAAYEKCAIDIMELELKLSLKDNNQISYYSGLAGALHILSREDKLRGSEYYYEIIDTISKELLKRQTLDTKYGIKGWDTLGKNYPISGLGNGVAGVGLALASAYSVIRSDELLYAYKDAFELEDKMFSEKLNNWPDFRKSPVADSSINGYCSGAPGIGSAYISLCKINIHDYENMLELAIDSVLSSNMHTRDHYCCGNASTIEFLFDAGKLLGRKDLIYEAHDRLERVCRIKAQKGEFSFMTSKYLNYSPLGLLEGISGLGHVLLKADNPELGNLILLD